MALSTNKEQKYKTITPYDLSANDNPGAVISHPLLNGHNYDEWAVNLRMALSSRKKFGFLDGSLPKPASDSPYLEDWTANNHLLVGWIKQTIDPKLRFSISTREIAKDLWDIIKKRFSLKSGARLQQLRNSLATCKQNGSTVDDYFGRLTKLWDGIAECMNSKICTCNKCECDLNSVHEKEREVLRVHDFLSGLDDSVHGVILSQICAIIPLPDLDSVYQTVSQNETLRSNTTADNPVMSFVAQSSSNRRPGTVHTKELSKQSSNDFSANRGGQGSRDGSKQCSVCGMKGHEASECFKVIGFPEWWGERNKNRSSLAGRGRGAPSRANAAQVYTATAGSSSEITEHDRQGLIGLSDDQWTADCGSKTYQCGEINNDLEW